jgi:hypothetical protein
LERDANNQEMAGFLREEIEATSDSIRDTTTSMLSPKRSRNGSPRDGVGRLCEQAQPRAQCNTRKVLRAHEPERSVHQWDCGMMRSDEHPLLL